MCSSGSTLTPFDQEIKRTACAIRRVVRKVTLAQRILVQDYPLISSDAEEEIIMSVVPPPTRGNYCKRTNEGHVSRGFVLENPSNFDIQKFMLSSLRYNSFDGNGIRDPWEHLARFYETTSMYRPTDIIEDQVKLRLFVLSLIRRAKY